MNKFIKYLLNIVIILIWTAIYYLQFERPHIIRIVHNISPNLLATSLLHGLFWISWISVPFLLFAIIKGRFFCWNICPIGLIQDLVPSFGTLQAKQSQTNLYFFLALFIVAFFGINLLAFFDPLVIFSRALISLKMRLLDFLVFFTPATIILLLNIYKKRFWCFKLCPLGSLIDWINRIKTKQYKYDVERRKILIALGSGIALGGLLKWINLNPKPVNKRLLRPPGSLPENKFTDRCIRCGSCMATCLTGTLTPAFLESGMEGIFTPRLIPRIAECDEYCNKCGKACPTQAIKKLPLGIKKRFKIGTAKVDRTKCIAWSQNSLCLICQEFCPYLAINKINNKNRTPSPQVIPDYCRGCGICEKNCPVTPVRAIKVYNTGAGKIITDQRRLPPTKDQRPRTKD